VAAWAPLFWQHVGSWVFWLWVWLVLLSWCSLLRLMLDHSKRMHATIYHY